jgi:hypothetical protein
MTAFGVRRCLVAAMLATAAFTVRPAYALYQEVTCERNFMKGDIELDSEGLDWVQSRHMAYRIIFEKDVHGEQRPAWSGRPNWVFGMCLIEAHIRTIPEPPVHVAPIQRAAPSTPIP